ncbi:hypothetical protein LC593_31425 [Nostoc sp. CHAB 5844]|nr:hypothetical protein [Nostoc sp. CHAB 5844]
METLNSITIPSYWTQPKYSLGPRTQQGIIVGLQYYPNSETYDWSNGSWRYAVADCHDCLEVVHLDEEKIQLLSPQQLQIQIQEEIQIYQSKIDALNEQMKISQLLMATRK